MARFRFSLSGFDVGHDAVHVAGHCGQSAREVTSSSPGGEDPIPGRHVRVAAGTVEPGMDLSNRLHCYSVRAV